MCIFKTALYDGLKFKMYKICDKIKNEKTYVYVTV